MQTGPKPVYAVFENFQEQSRSSEARLHKGFIRRDLFVWLLHALGCHCLDIFYACRRCCRRMSLSRMPFGLHNKPARCPSNRHNLYPQNILTFKPRAASRLNLGKILPNRFLRSDSILILWSDSLKWTKKPGAEKSSFLFTSHTESVFS